MSARAALVAIPILFLLVSTAVEPGVKYGDAVPAVIRPSDLERIQRVLHLARFSVIAAVRLGAEEGREAVIAEPLTDEALAKVKAACEAGGFCPDPVGFVAARVRIVVLDGPDVVPVVTIEKEAQYRGRRLVDLEGLGLGGNILGWNGRAEAANGHVALALTPITEIDGGRAGAGLDPPVLIRWNPDRNRFQTYDCVRAEDDAVRCGFQDEPSD
jgi:hypothetical protein